MKFNKEELLSSLSNRVETQIQTAISQFQNQSEQVLLQASSTGGWNIAQCLDHLNSYGDYYLPKLQKVLRSSSKANNAAFESGWLGDYFTKMMEPSAKKYKAFKGHVPQQNLDAYAVVAKFISQLEELTSLLQKAAVSDLNTRVPISIIPLIRLKTGDVLRFLIAHNERHVQQACRNLKSR